MMRKFLILITFLLGANLFAQNTQIVVDETWNVKSPVYKLSIKGTDTSANIARKAFSTHGAFKLDATSPNYTLEIQNNGENSVMYSIKGANVNFSSVVSGSSQSEAVAKACDEAVNKMLGTPSYFAGKLVFVSDRTGNTEIYTSDMLFQNIKCLTSDKSDSLLPHWSPDGRKIIYTGYYRSGLMDLYEITLNPLTRRTFASYRGTNTGGAFSPDGSKVAMILTSTGSAELWIADANGKNAKRLTNNTAAEASASWSPNGAELVLSSDLMGSPQIYKISANGGKMSRVPTKISGYCTEPDWNPLYPNLIAFTIAQGGSFQVAVFDSKTGESKVITSGGASTTPRWTNDGRHIIFTKSYGKSRSLYIVDSLTQKQSALHSKSMGSCSEADFIYLK